MQRTKECTYLTTVFCLRLLWDTIYEDWSKSAADRGLTVTEEQVLWVIWLFESSSVTDVAQRLQRDKGTISKCIYSLETNGLIIRKAGVDRRSYSFAITDEGEKVRRSLCLGRGDNTAFGLAYAKLTRIEQEAFLKSILALLNHLEGENYMSDVVQSLAQVAEQGAVR